MYVSTYMRIRRGRGLVSFGKDRGVPNAAFEGFEVDVGFGSNVRRFSEGSGGDSGGFWEGKCKPK